MHGMLLSSRSLPKDLAVLSCRRYLINAVAFSTVFLWAIQVVKWPVTASMLEFVDGFLLCDNPPTTYQACPGC